MARRHKVASQAVHSSRLQLKFRRRREGKTDYYARKRLISQAKYKYGARKYRLVTRLTNKYVVCQIVYPKIDGDHVLAAAYSWELKNYGIKYGLKNWAAAYATGLLVARRALNSIGLDEQYKGEEEPEGTFTLTQKEDQDNNPLKAILDVGLRRTSTGSRVFAAMKGASDGGLHIPHSESRFPGYDIETKELDSETLRKYIFGGHVAEYMEVLLEDDEERYKQQFSALVNDGVEPDQLEEMYANAHAKIREDPTAKPTNKKDVSVYKQRVKASRIPKSTLEERKARIQAKLDKFREERED